MYALSAWILRKTGKRRRRLTDDPPTESYQSIEEHASADSGMAQTNGIHRETTPVDTSIVPPGRVISTSMMRQGQNTEANRKNGI